MAFLGAISCRKSCHILIDGNAKTSWFERKKVNFISVSLINYFILILYLQSLIYRTFCKLLSVQAIAHSYLTNVLTRCFLLILHILVSHMLQRMS